MAASLNETGSKILYAGSASIFKTNFDAFIRSLDANPGKESAAQAAELYLDLNSYLAEWTLKPLIAKGELAQKDLDDAASALAAFIKKNDPALFSETEKEATSIAASQTRKMCDKTRNAQLHTYWGHDYCTGMDHSLRRGARFVTSNPAKINLFRQENPEKWNTLLNEARNQNPGVDIERLISIMFVKVTAINARVLRPIFDATGGSDGFVCVQTNPKNIGDSKKMLEEILFWEEEYKRELGAGPVNVVYKLPAVKAAVEPVRELVSRGVRVCMTLNFTVTQHEVFGELIQGGKHPGFVVLMSGFLDDNVALELEKKGVADPKKFASWAGVAVMRKSYAGIRARKWGGKVVPMAAAIRGPYTINCCLTDHADAPVYFTTMTAKIEEFDGAERALASEMEQPIPEEIMAGLAKSDIFNQAYNPDRLDMDGLNDFIPLQAVLKVFTEAYNDIEKSL